MFDDLRNVIHGFLGGLVSDLERSNPEAALDLERDNLEKQIAQYNQGLAAHAGLCDRLMTQVKKLEAEQKDLSAKTGEHLQAGSRDDASIYAVKLQTVERELQENRAQLEQAEKTYKELVKARDVAVEGARARIASLHNSIRDNRMKQAAARMTETAAQMAAPSEITGDTLDRLQAMVEEERTKASGRVRLATDSLHSSDVNSKQPGAAASAQDLAEQALADFAARQGIALEPRGSDADTSAPVKSMGVAQEDAPPVSNSAPAQTSESAPNNAAASGNAPTPNTAGPKES